MVTDDDFAAAMRRLETVERRCDVIEGQDTPAPFTGTDEPGQVDFLSQMRGSPGFIVDEGVARDTPCTCYHVKEHDLCFSKGVVGALDQEQEALFCEAKNYRDLTPAQRQRLEHFQESADSCKVEIADVPKGEELEPWLGCMSRELRARGIER